jgi:hypothetical protein
MAENEDDAYWVMEVKHKKYTKMLEITVSDAIT